MGIPTIWRIVDGSIAAGDTALAEGSVLIGNASGVASALNGKTNTQILVGNGTTMTSVAISSDATMTNAGALTIANDAVTEAKVADGSGVSGLGVAKYAYALYDFATDTGGAPGAITLTSACTIPDNAVVTLDSVDVLTTFTSAGPDAATIKVGLATDGDLSTAIAINDGSNPWDAGAHFGSVYTPIAVKTTAARLIVVTSAVQAITAGKCVFCFRYYVTV